MRRTFPAAKWLPISGATVWLGIAGWLGVNLRWKNELIRWLTGRNHKLQALVHGCWWWSGMAVLLIVAVAAGIWVWRRPAAPAAVWPPRARQVMPRWFGWALVAICVTATAIRWPRMGQSLYNDEAYAFRRHFAGQWTPPDKGEKPVFKPLGWMDACYDNRMGNNSVFYSFGAHLCDTVWRNSGGVKDGAVNETAVRLPALLGGLAGIVAIALLGARIAGAPLGLTLALLAAIHPLHIRYSTEARPHGLLLFLLPLYFLALDSALRLSRWRPWLIFGAAQAAVLTAFFGCLWLLVYTNLLILGAAAWECLSLRKFHPLFSRIVVIATAGLSSLLTGAVLAAPQFIQLYRILKDPEFMRGPLDWTWVSDAGGMLLLGMRGPALDPGNAAALSWTGVMQSHPLAGALALVLIAAPVLAGIVKLLTDTGIGRNALAATGLALGTAIVVAKASGITLLPWYALFALPAVILAVGAGLLSAAQHLRREWAVALASIFATALLGTWGRADIHYAATPREPNREVAAYLDRFSENIDTRRQPLKAALWSDSPIYDPKIVGIRSLAQLKNLVEAAFTAGRGVILDTGLTDSMTDQDGIMHYLESETDFELISILRGNDHRMHTHQVWYARPGPRPAGRTRSRSVQKGRTSRRVAAN